MDCPFFMFPKCVLCLRVAILSFSASRQAVPSKLTPKADVFPINLESLTSKLSSASDDSSSQPGLRP